MRHTFDRMLVITSPDDKETQKVCDYYYVEYLATDIMYENDAPFNKGKAISLGLDYLKSDDWIVHIDSDIALPPRFNEYIRAKNYNKDNIYGIDRLDIKDWNTWISFCCNPHKMHYVGSTWANFPVMYRVTQGLSYYPIGYFQMWNAKSKYYDGVYHNISNNAADSDLKFTSKWPAENRILIPEVYVYHLSSEGDNKTIGANWNKRVTPRFGPN